ncbi:hypothetical protein FB45DRAFT_935086 [Roridomyces roridus]|uniref:Uncharacterized protein n=1 Tax=Roridomyces roridus TaxID=1738132 RepID=A0AAD7FCM1_9AGAR|nr:hypothetical protein FB45DRAFT_935086 [Roridomyces roridus]
MRITVVAFFCTMLSTVLALPTPRHHKESSRNAAPFNPTSASQGKRSLPALPQEASNLRPIPGPVFVKVGA